MTFNRGPFLLNVPQQIPVGKRGYVGMLRVLKLVRSVVQYIPALFGVFYLYPSMYMFCIGKVQFPRVHSSPSMLSLPVRDPDTHTTTK